MCRKDQNNSGNFFFATLLVNCLSWPCRNQEKQARSFPLGLVSVDPRMFHFCPRVSYSTRNMLMAMELSTDDTPISYSVKIKLFTQISRKAVKKEIPGHEPKWHQNTASGSWKFNFYYVNSDFSTLTSCIFYTPWVIRSHSTSLESSQIW